MCGIVCAFDIKGENEVVRSIVLKMAQKLRCPSYPTFPYGKSDRA